VQFPDFNPTLLQLGPIAIRWYALAYIAGILLGWRYARALLENRGLWGDARPPLDLPALDDLVLWITVGIIGGGRLGYVVFYEPAVIWRSPLEILQVWHGGMSFHGGLIGVALALLVFAHRRGLSARGLGDVIAACAPIGLFFGRLANFINGELWGRVTHVPWGMVFCNPRLMAANGGVCPAGLSPRHPSQLYEAALEGVLLFLLLRLASHRAGWLSRRGAVAGLFLVLYGLFRITLETVRNPDLTMPTFPLGVTMGMMLSTPLVVLGAGLLWRALRPTGR
jgi:phosphatidylglycerol:prolipoprotein diacylglycerol transferase